MSRRHLKKLNAAAQGTRFVHGGAAPDEATGAVTPAIHLTSTYAQEAPGRHKGYDYSRAGNPTRDRFEELLATMEGGRHGLAFASGLAAVDAVAGLLRPGDHVVCGQDVYGGTYRLFMRKYAELGIRFDFVDTTDLDEIRRVAGPTTALLWLESPSNPLLTLTDIRQAAAIARKANSKVLVAVDNTFATPVLQQPLTLGADIVCHSLTKYLGGHSDVIGGALVTDTPKLHEKLKFLQFAAGAVLSPFDSWLTMRGIRTLGVRVDRHCDNAEVIARMLQRHPKVARVHYPGLNSHPQHKLAKRQMSRFGGMISCELKATLKQSERFVSRRRWFTLAESLGGVESLIEHPASMTHASIPAEERRRIGLADGLIRLSVGIEDIQDLKNDLAEGLEALK